MKVHLHNFSKIKSQEEVTKQYNSLMDPDSDPVGPKTYESDGSGFATLLILKYFYVVIFLY